MIDILIEFMICIFEIYVFYDFLHDILEGRFDYLRFGGTCMNMWRNK